MLCHFMLFSGVTWPKSALIMTAFLPGQVSLVGAGASVELALGHHQSIDAHGCLASLDGRDGKSSQGRKYQEESRIHLKVGELSCSDL